MVLGDLTVPGFSIPWSPLRPRSSQDVDDAMLLDPPDPVDLLIAHTHADQAVNLGARQIFFMFRIAKKKPQQKPQQKPQHSPSKRSNLSICPTLHQAVLRHQAVGLCTRQDEWTEEGEQQTEEQVGLRWWGIPKVDVKTTSKRRKIDVIDDWISWISWIVRDFGCWATYIYCFTLIKPDWLRPLIDTHRFYIDMYCFQDQLKAPARGWFFWWQFHMCLIHWYETYP